MTREEAINRIGELAMYAREQGWDYEYTEAFEVLKGEPCEDTISMSVIEDIKAGIRALPKTYPFVNHLDTYVKEDDVLEIINRHIGKEDE